MMLHHHLGKGVRRSHEKRIPSLSIPEEEGTAQRIDDFFVLMTSSSGKGGPFFEPLRGGERCESEKKPLLSDQGGKSRSS